MNVSVKLPNVKFLKRVLARAIVCGILLILPSCAIPHLRQGESAPGMPDAFPAGTTTENSAQLGIDEFFNDPTLTNLIEQALEGNRELKILNEEVAIAGNEVLARKGAYLPFIGVGAVASAEKSSIYTRNGAVDQNVPIAPGQPIPNPLGNYGAGLNVFWQLDIWKQLRNARDAAAERYFAAVERRNFFVTRLVAETAENYYKLMALDKRLENLDQTIAIQEKSLGTARALLAQARGTDLPVQRFTADVRKNQSEKFVVKQEIVETENRINFLLNRYPQPVERNSSAFFTLNLPALSVGVPSQLLQNRPDIRQAERELAAAGLDVKVARAKFFPQLTLTGSVGYEAFNPRYLVDPGALAANVAGNLAGPLVNKLAIKAEYMSANARQLEALYNYQRVVLNAFTEVVNRVSMVENYTKSIELKQQQLVALEGSVKSATSLWKNVRVEYLEPLLAQRDLMEGRMVLIETKKQQLTAIVNAYQSLGGGVPTSMATPEPIRAARAEHPLRRFWTSVTHAE